MVVKVERTGKQAIYYYKKYMKKLVAKIKKNMGKQLLPFRINDELLTHLKKNYIKMSIRTFFGNLINNLLGGNKIILLAL